jgi:hypothetical protein
MNILSILSLIFLLLPELALACPNHAINLPGLPNSSETIYLKLGLLLTLTIPLGFVAGRAVKRLAPAGKVAILALVAAGFLLAGNHSSWACHGTEAVAPILQEVHAAQLDFHKKHGVYAASFEELGMAPSSDQYSYFLPSQMLSAIHPLPKPGVDLSRLPEGVFPAASSDRFTVVALAFAEPDRLDVWTMDQDKVLKEWSLPAVSKKEHKLRNDEPVSWRGAFNGLAHKFEGALTWITLLLGLAIGFNLSRRVIPTPRLVSL